MLQVVGPSRVCLHPLESLRATSALVADPSEYIADGTAGPLKRCVVSHRIHGTGIYTDLYLAGVFMVKVGKYTIHGSYGFHCWETSGHSEKKAVFIGVEVGKHILWMLFWGGAWWSI